MDGEYSGDSQTHVDTLIRDYVPYVIHNATHNNQLRGPTIPGLYRLETGCVISV